MRRKDKDMSLDDLLAEAEREEQANQAADDIETDKTV